MRGLRGAWAAIAWCAWLGVAGCTLGPESRLPGAPAPATGPAAAPAAAATRADTVSARIIAFNDFHGQLEPGELTLRVPDPQQPSQSLTVSSGGAAFLAGKIQALRVGHPHSIVVSSGDLIGASPLVSALFRDEPTIEVMNAMGLELNAVGNHEFDRGVAELRRIAAGGCRADDGPPGLASCEGPQGAHAGARFDFLAANVEQADGRALFKPWVVREFGGVKVAFIGAVLRGTPTIVTPSGVAGVSFRDEAATINRHVETLKREQGVEAFVVLLHEGGLTDGRDWNDPRCPGARGEVFGIADRLRPEVDLVLSGHTHQGYNCVRNAPGNPGLRIMQAYANGRGVSVVDLVLDVRTGDVVRSESRAVNLPVANDRNTDPTVRARFPAAAPDPAVERIVEHYVARARPRTQRVVGRISAPLARAPSPGGDSPVGRLIADAQLAATRAPQHGGAVLALTNPGGIRADLSCAGTPPCPVDYGQLFGVQPFGNSLVVMTLSGAQVKQVLEQQFLGVNLERPRILQPSAGLAYAWSPRAPLGDRVRDLVLDGEPVLPARSYRVVVNSFLAEGGDGFTVFTQGDQLLGGPQDLDALLEYFAAATPVGPVSAARIVRQP